MSEHTLAARLLAFAPPVMPPELPITDISYVVEDTAVGRMLLARQESGPLIASAYVPDADAEDVLLARLARRVSPRILRGRMRGETRRARRASKTSSASASGTYADAIRGPDSWRANNIRPTAVSSTT